MIQEEVPLVEAPEPQESQIAMGQVLPPSKIGDDDLPPDMIEEEDKSGEAARGREFVEKIRNEQPFDYEPAPAPDGILRDTRKVEDLENGDEYDGQFDSLGRRNGRGTKFWPDGSCYEGYWKDD